MRIAVGSAFRDCQGNVYRYVRRVKALQELLGPEHHVRIIAAEGDSADYTRMELRTSAGAAGLELELTECSHGGPYYGSTEDPRRMAALSHVLNSIMGAVGEGDDILFYVEQDLMWEPQVARALLRAVEEFEHGDRGFSVIAPLVMAGECFYDIWGFRTPDGRRFSPFHPYWSELSFEEGVVTEVGSAGSCFAVSGDVARRARVKNDMALVGWCEDVRSLGHRVGVRGDLTVRQA